MRTGRARLRRPVRIIAYFPSILDLGIDNIRGRIADLRELGERKGVPSYLIDSEADLDPAWFEPGMTIGLSAGASAPEALVQRVLLRLRELGASSVREMAGEKESVVFHLPRELRAGEIAKA